MSKAYFILFIGFFILFTSQSSKKDLEKKKKEVEEELAMTKKYLSETSKKKNVSIKELNTIVRQIEIRENLVETINEEINFVADDVNSKRDEVENINIAINQEKNNYAKAIIQNYKNRKSFNIAYYIFTAKSFNQMIHRLKLYKYFSIEEEKYINKINFQKTQLESSLNQLQILKQSKEVLVVQKQNELKTLETDKTQKNSVISNLSGKEKDLKQQLAKQKKAKEELNRKLQALIAKEIAEAKEKAKKSAPKQSDKNNPDKPKTVSEPTLTPEARLISDNFANNKGVMPWPVEKGFISERFGTKVHEKLDNITIQNNGIDIQTTPNANVRVIFKGTVAAIIQIPGMGTTVLVSHGDFYTVYSKLNSTTVKQGDILQAKQNIGTVDKDEDGTYELHFEIWKNQDKQNPEAWISKK